MDLLFSNDRFVFEDKYRNIHIVAGYENDIAIYARRYEFSKESYARRFQQMLNRRKNIYKNNMEGESCAIFYCHIASFHYKHVNIGLCSECNEFVFGDNVKLDDCEQSMIKELLPDVKYQDIHFAIRNDERMFVLSTSSYTTYRTEFTITDWNLFNNRVEIDGRYGKIIEPRIFAEVMKRKYWRRLMTFAHVALIQDVIQLIIGIFLCV
jgi:hypothetical protein